MAELWMELSMGGSVPPCHSLGSTYLQRLYILVCFLSHPEARQILSLEKKVSNAPAACGKV